MNSDEATSSRPSSSKPRKERRRKLLVPRKGNRPVDAPDKMKEEIWRKWAEWSDKPDKRPIQWDSPSQDRRKVLDKHFAEKYKDYRKFFSGPESLHGFNIKKPLSGVQKALARWNAMSTEAQEVEAKNTFLAYSKTMQENTTKKALDNNFDDIMQEGSVKRLSLLRSSLNYKEEKKDGKTKILNNGVGSPFYFMALVLSQKPTIVKQWNEEASGENNQQPLVGASHGSSHGSARIDQQMPRSGRSKWF
ncbi:hypothetical protein T439DRAFT_378443 [Meredithblackwellia eburnea MCA 4105]